MNAIWHDWVHDFLTGAKSRIPDRRDWAWGRSFRRLEAL